MTEQDKAEHPEQTAPSSLAAAPAAVLDAINDIVVVCDSNGRIQQFSENLCRLTGVSREQLRGQELALHDVQLAEPQAWRAIGEELDSRGQVRRVGGLRQPDGSTIRIEWLVRRVLEGQRVYDVWSARAASPGAPAELRHLEQERGQLARVADERARELQRINGELEQALRAKDDFFAGISHEFRTPLNAILGLSEALLEELHGPLNPGQTEYISGIVESGRHLLSLINDILDISRYRAGGMELDTAPVALREVYEASIRMVRPAIKAKKLSFSIKDDESVTTLVVDERRLRQMLVNLLANACKFTPEGGSLGLEVLGDQKRQEVTLTVWDTGVGIPSDQIDRLFKPFVQLESGLSNAQPGTGLGLSLVLAMAELHGGSVRVDSELGRGSRFTITLPWSGSNLGKQPSKPELTPNWDAQSFTGQTLTEDNPMINAAEIVALARQAASGNLTKRKPSVLVVDDNEANLRMLGDYLPLHGFQVFTARNGEEGYNKALMRRPGVILLDIKMPGLSGLDVIAHLRRRSETAAIPVVVVTALALPSDRRRCIAAGATHFFSKPVRLGKLLATIKKLSPPILD